MMRVNFQQISNFHMSTTQPNGSEANRSGLLNEQTHLNRGKAFPCQKFDTINRNTSKSFKLNRKIQMTLNQSQWDQSGVEFQNDVNENFISSMSYITDMEIQFAKQSFEQTKSQLSNAVKDLKRNKQYLRQVKIELKISEDAIPQDLTRKIMYGILLELKERDEKRIESSEKYLKRCLEKVVQAINKLTALQYARTQQMF